MRWQHPRHAMEKPTNSVRLLYCLILVQFVIHLVSFFYLHLRIVRVEHNCHEPQIADQPLFRRKRSGSLPAPEDNDVADIFRVRIFKPLFLHFFETFYSSSNKKYKKNNRESQIQIRPFWKVLKFENFSFLISKV